MSMFGRKYRIECDRIRAQFSPYLDNRLESVERDEVTFHAERCDDCGHELASLRATRDLIHLMPMADIPRAFVLTQAPSRRSWISFEIPAISFGNAMRVGAVATVIVFALLLSLDLSGVLSERNSGPGEVAAVETGETVEVASPSSTPDDNHMTGVLTGGNVGIPEALPPDSDSDIRYGIGLSAIPQTPTDVLGNNIPDSSEAVNLNGESGVSSPSPRSSTPSWLLPLEITAGVLIVIFACISLVIWQRKQAIR